MGGRERMIPRTKPTALDDAEALLARGPHRNALFPTALLRRLIDDRTNDRIGEAESAAIALRACLVSVDNFGGVEVMSTTDDRYGRIATNDVITALDQIDPVIVSELGGVLISRAVSPSPK